MRMPSRSCCVVSPLLALTVLMATAAAAADPAAPPIELLRKELQYQLPVMWRVTDLTVQDAFEREAGKQGVWKARFRAGIETSEPTYVPTDLGVGAITVIRPAYPAGVKRKVNGRVTAELAAGGWNLRFTLDNRPTMTAGLPRDYFTGRIVEEGSDEHLALIEREHQARVQRAMDQHRAALAALRLKHDAELRAVEASLAEADRLDAARAEVAKRVEAVRTAIHGLVATADSLATEAVSNGPALSQWAERGFDGSVKARRGSTAAELVGAPDAGKCDPKRRTEQAWFVGGHETGEQSVTVSFLEPVIPTAVVIYETASTGFVKALTLQGENPKQVAHEAVVDMHKGCSGDALFPIAGVTFPVRQVTIVVDGDRPGNKAIDAVQLRGLKQHD